MYQGGYDNQETYFNQSRYLMYPLQKRQRQVTRSIEIPLNKQFAITVSVDDVKSSFSLELFVYPFRQSQNYNRDNMNYRESRNSYYRGRGGNQFNYNSTRQYLLDDNFQNGNFPPRSSQSQIDNFLSRLSMIVVYHKN